MVKRVVNNYQPVDLSQYEQKSALVWSTNNIRLPKGAPWNFQHRRWQVKIFDDAPNSLVVIKPTQIGMTTLMLCKMLHFATYNNVRVMYTLPRQDDVYDLINGRVDTMFKDSPRLSDNLGSVDNVRLKVYLKSYIHFMESTVTPRMLDVDLLINDEVDMSNQDNLEQYIARLDASDYKMHWRISTPTTKGFGIHAMYDASNKNTWLVKCPRCGKHQKLDWDTNVRHANSETWIACAECDKQLDVETIQAGQWVPEFPSREAIGYSVSQLMVTSISPNALWDDFKRMRTKNFFNLRLGEPYEPASGAITKALIYDKCFNDTHSKQTSGSGYFLGADQGNDIHVAIGKVDGETLKIVYMEVIPFEQGFDKLKQLMDRFQIKKAVVDALPNRHSSNSFVKSYKGRRAVVAFYTQADTTYKENPNELEVSINRSVSFDYLFEKIQSGHVQIYGSRSNLSSELRTAVSHLTNMRRGEVVSSTKMGGEKTEVSWMNVGADHFAHAINYLNIAADLGGYDRGFRVVDLDSNEKKEETIRQSVIPSHFALGRALAGATRRLAR